MEERGPMEILGAILDEVEGLRRTDAKSHLPECLLREARAALEVSTTGASGVGQLGALDGLAGRTVTHVFDGNLKRAQVVIVCADGSFLALETERDGDESFISVDTPRHWGRPTNGLADYLEPSEMVEVGLMTKAEQAKAERDAKEAELQQLMKRNEAQIERVRKELARLEGQADTRDHQAAQRCEGAHMTPT